MVNARNGRTRNRHARSEYGKALGAVVACLCDRPDVLLRMGILVGPSDDAIVSEKTGNAQRHDVSSEQSGSTAQGVRRGGINGGPVRLRIGWRIQRLPRW